MGIKKTGKPLIKYTDYEIYMQSLRACCFATIMLIFIYFDIIRYFLGMFAIMFLVVFIPLLICNRFKGQLLTGFKELRYIDDFDKLSLELENNGLCLQRKVGKYYFFNVKGLVSTLPEVRVKECGDHCILSVAEILKGRFDSERFISRDLQEVVNAEIQNIRSA